MSSIKPPGGPSGVRPPTLPPVDGTPATGGPAGPDFREALATGTAKSAQAPSAPNTAAPAAAAGSHQGVIDALRAGTISPKEAVRALTDQAIARGNLPPAMRPALEAHLQSVLSQDPLVRGLLEQMGAATRDEP